MFYELSARITNHVKGMVEEVTGSSIDGTEDDVSVLYDGRRSFILLTNNGFFEMKVNPTSVSSISKEKVQESTKDSSLDYILDKFM